MTQYSVLRYYYQSQIEHATVQHISIHKLKWTASRFNSSVLANALKLGLKTCPNNLG